MDTNIQSYTYNIVCATNPLNTLADEIGSVMGDIIGDIHLVGLLAFFFFTALLFTLIAHTVILLVLEIPVLFICMSIGAWPAHIRLLMAIGIGVVVAIGFLKLVRR